MLLFKILYCTQYNSKHVFLFAFSLRFKWGLGGVNHRSLVLKISPLSTDIKDLLPPLQHVKTLLQGVLHRLLVLLLGLLAAQRVLLKELGVLHCVHEAGAG